MKTLFWGVMLLLLPTLLCAQVKTEFKIDAFNLIYKDPHISLEIMPTKKIGFELGVKYNFDEIYLDTTQVILLSTNSKIRFSQQSISGLASIKFYPFPNKFSNRIFFGFYFHQEFETKEAENYESLYQEIYGRVSTLEKNRSAVGVTLGYKWFPRRKQKFFIEGAINFDRNIKSFSDDNKTSADELSMVFIKFGKRF